MLPPLKIENFYYFEDNTDGIFCKDFWEILIIFRITQIDKTYVLDCQIIVK